MQLTLQLHVALSVFRSVRPSIQQGKIGSFLKKNFVIFSLLVERMKGRKEGGKEGRKEQRKEGSK